MKEPRAKPDNSDNVARAGNRFRHGIVQALSPFIDRKVVADT
jgi:hypothetical protein